MTKGELLERCVSDKERLAVERFTVGSPTLTHERLLRVLEFFRLEGSDTVTIDAALFAEVKGLIEDTAHTCVGVGAAEELGKVAKTVLDRLKTQT